MRSAVLTLLPAVAPTLPGWLILAGLSVLAKSGRAGLEQDRRIRGGRRRGVRGR